MFALFHRNIFFQSSTLFPGKLFFNFPLICTKSPTKIETRFRNRDGSRVIQWFGQFRTLPFFSPKYPFPYVGGKIDFINRKCVQSLLFTEELTKVIKSVIVLKCEKTRHAVLGRFQALWQCFLSETQRIDDFFTFWWSGTNWNRGFGKVDFVFLYVFNRFRVKVINILAAPINPKLLKFSIDFPL